MGKPQEINLEHLDVVWKLLKDEIEKQANTFQWLKQASADDWMKKIQLMITKKWEDKRKYADNFFCGVTGLEEVTLKSNNGFQMFVSRISQALLRRRVEWQAYGSNFQKSGEIIDDCVVKINTSGAPAIFSVVIGPATRHIPVAKSQKRSAPPPSATATRIPAKKVKPSEDENFSAFPDDFSSMLDQTHSQMVAMESLFGSDSPPPSTWGKLSGTTWYCFFLGLLI